MFWRREDGAVGVGDGSDDIALALTADAWSRTGMLLARAAAAAPVVRLRSGLVLVADDKPITAPRLPLDAKLKPMQQFDRTLCRIGERFGPLRRERVEQELEYPAQALRCAPEG